MKKEREQKEEPTAEEQPQSGGKDHLLVVLQHMDKTSQAISKNNTAIKN